MNSEIKKTLKKIYEKYFEYAYLPIDSKKIKELRIKYQIKLFKEIPLAWVVSRRFSIYLSLIFVKFKIHPDWVTFLMIPTSLFAGISFFIQSDYNSYLGYFFLHLWFIIDCSDGEVARISNKTSNYGKQYDYLIHIISHPPMILGYSYYIYKSTGDFLAIWTGVTFLIINLISRAKLPLEKYFFITKNKDIFNSNILINYIRKYFVTVPALILFMSIIEIFRLYRETIFLPSFICFTVMSLISVILDLFHKVFEILRGDFQEIN